MKNRALYTALLTIGCAAASGCCFDNMYCCSDGAGPYGAADFSHEGDMITGGPSGSCDSCGGCGSGHCCGFGLIRLLKKVLTPCYGCGELYWNEFYNDPPANCEPCNNHGNWIGWHPWGRVWGKGLWRHGCCDDGGCGHAGHHTGAPRGTSHDGQVEIIEDWHDTGPTETLPAPNSRQNKSASTAKPRRLRRATYRRRAPAR